jgi:hypothetical protein
MWAAGGTEGTLLGASSSPELPDGSRGAARQLPQTGGHREPGEMYTYVHKTPSHRRKARAGAVEGGVIRWWIRLAERHVGPGCGPTALPTTIRVAATRRRSTKPTRVRVRTRNRATGASDASRFAVAPNIVRSRSFDLATGPRGAWPEAELDGPDRRSQGCLAVHPACFSTAPGVRQPGPSGPRERSESGPMVGYLTSQSGREPHSGGVPDSLRP